MALAAGSCAPREHLDAQKPTASPPANSGAPEEKPTAAPAPSASASAGAPLDDSQTASRKSCDEGDLVECFSAGYAYAEGRDVARDEARAVELYRKACDGGVGPSCFNLGRMYADGRGVTKDDARAMELYRKACAGGVKPACTRLEGPGGR